MAPTQVLLDETSPYRSRRVIVEYDTRTTAAYLLDPRGQVPGPCVAGQPRNRPGNQ